MTYEPTVTDPNGNPIQGLLVTVNNENTGESFSRTTDGGGYSNVAMLGRSEPGHRVTISIFDPELKFKGYVKGDAMTVAEANGKFPITLPFA